MKYKNIQFTDIARQTKSILERIRLFVTEES